ncbi:MAG: molybdenum cofactor guanylyltransferase MobA [Methylocystaceae bacterium]|nr:molybdenum cofactor guanylyltransferase MobA [Methylocystaceae bacterium]
MSKIGCVMLAGGLATRMGGGDKGFKNIGGRPIIERILETVRHQVDDIVINANGDPARFANLNLDVVADSVDGFVGPLAGILAGMDRFSVEYDWMLSVPTDTPFLPDDLVEKLFVPLKNNQAEIAIAHSGGFDHPVIGIWPTRLKDDLRAALVEEDIRKLKKWISRYRYQAVSWPDTPRDPFFNANRPEDLNIDLF